MSRTVSQLENYQKQWVHLTLESDAEKELYNNTTAAEGNFVELMEQAEERLCCLSAWLLELDSEQHSLLMQMAMEDRDRQAAPRELSDPSDSARQAQVGETDTAVLTHRTPREFHTPLPTMHIPPFFGDIQKWPEFYDSFYYSVEVSNLAPVMKFNQLKNLLKGKALKVVEGISVTNDNYQVAMEILEKRFGDKKRRISGLYIAS